MKKTLSHCPYIKDPIIRSYIHSGEDNKFDDFMRQHRFSKVDFDTQQMIHFINRFNTVSYTHLRAHETIRCIS
ncbi:hypothetical protein KFU41_25545, partial [Escherichia coli]|nr:hypothetical protein [Escherichia coli]